MRVGYSRQKDQHRQRLRGVRLEEQGGVRSQGAWQAGRNVGCALSVMGGPKISFIKSEALSCSCRWRIKYVGVGVGGGENQSKQAR